MQVATNWLGFPVLERLGRGGSASLAPLCQPDGIAVVASGIDAVVTGDPLRWHDLSNTDWYRAGVLR